MRAKAKAKAKTKLQMAFVNGVKAKLLPKEWGSQARLAKQAGIKPSYLNDILQYRKKGTEETRRRIAIALGTTYEELLNAGRRYGGKSKAPFTKECSKFEPYTEDYAACVYSFAASEVGIINSHFFTDESLKKLRPPGWVEYLDGAITDIDLYKRAKEEMRRIKKK